MHHRGNERNRRNDRARAVGDPRGRGRASDRDGKYGKGKQKRGASKRDDECHGGAFLSRTPRPPPWLVALSEMSSTPSASSAATSFISESTLPRITPAQASMRWMVGSDSAAASARPR